MKLRFNLFASAAGVRNVAQADMQYVIRLITLIQNTPGMEKNSLLALDQY